MLLCVYLFCASARLADHRPVNELDDLARRDVPVLRLSWALPADPPRVALVDVRPRHAPPAFDASTEAEPLPELPDSTWIGGRPILFDQGAK